MNDSVNAVIHFFNDIVAQIIPGLLCILMLSLCIDRYDDVFSSSPMVLIAVTYVLGHVLLSLREYLINKVKLIKGKISDKGYENKSNLKASNTYKRFEELIGSKNNDLSFHDTRCMAMTISAEGASLGRRFMFLSLFCEGSSISFLLFGPLLIAKVMHEHGIVEFIPYTLLANLLLVVLVIYPLEKRAQEFKRRALDVPFSCAVAELIGKKL